MLVIDNLTFCFTCANGHLDVVRYLLDRGCLKKVNILAEEECAFRIACFNNNLPLAAYLLEIKPNINVHAMENYAFRWACFNGNMQIVELIVKHTIH